MLQKIPPPPANLNIICPKEKNVGLPVVKAGIQTANAAEVSYVKWALAGTNKLIRSQKLNIVGSAAPYTGQYVINGLEGGKSYVIVVDEASTQKPFSLTCNIPEGLIETNATLVKPNVLRITGTVYNTQLGGTVYVAFGHKDGNFVKPKPVKVNSNNGTFVVDIPVAEGENRYRVTYTNGENPVVRSDIYTFMVEPKDEPNPDNPNPDNPNPDNPNPDNPNPDNPNPDNPKPDNPNPDNPNPDNPKPDPKPTYTPSSVLPIVSDTPQVLGSDASNNSNVVTTANTEVKAAKVVAKKGNALANTGSVSGAVAVSAFVMVVIGGVLVARRRRA